MKHLLILSALLLATTNADANTLPKSVQGLWAFEPSDCEKEDSDGRLTIEPNIVLFSVTGYDVKRVTRLKDGTLKISGFVSSEGEAGREKGGLSLRLLSPDRLQVDKGTVYRRCNPKAR